MDHNLCARHLQAVMISLGKWDFFLESQNTTLLYFFYMIQQHLKSRFLKYKKLVDR